MQQKEPFYYKFWFVWLGLTALYLIPFLSTPAHFLVGLFVPFGFFNATLLIKMVSNLEFVGFIALASLVLSLIFADGAASKLHIKNVIGRLIFNLAWLLLLTLSVDLLLWGDWQSFAMLQNGAF